MSKQPIKNSAWRRPSTPPTNTVRTRTECTKIQVQKTWEALTPGDCVCDERGRQYTLGKDFSLTAESLVLYPVDGHPRVRVSSNVLRSYKFPSFEVSVPLEGK